MGRAPCCDKTKVKRGPWSPEEDTTLKNYVQKYGTGGNWIAFPHKAGLKRCGKSCRLRWLNYLRPAIKHGGFTEEEDNVILTLYNNIGSRWSVIASQLPGRTDNDVKNYWNTKLKKKLLAAAGATSSSLNSTLLNNNSGNSSNFPTNPMMNFSLQVPPPLTNYSDTFHQAYSIDNYNSSTDQQLVSEMFYNELSHDHHINLDNNFPLPRLQENCQNNGSSSQEISSSLSNWSDNNTINGDQEVGFLMEYNKPSNYGVLNHQEKLMGGDEEIRNSVKYYSYTSSSLLANISETEPSHGLHHRSSSGIF